MISVNVPESLRINPNEKVGIRDGVATELRAKWPVTSRQKHPLEQWTDLIPKSIPGQFLPLLPRCSYESLARPWINVAGCGQR